MGLRWGDIEEVRELHLGHRQGNSEKGGGGPKVLIFHFVPHVVPHVHWGGDHPREQYFITLA